MRLLAITILMVLTAMLATGFGLAKVHHVRKKSVDRIEARVVMPVGNLSVEYRRLFREASSREARLQIIESTRGLGPEVVPFLVELAASTQDQGLREAALSVLGERGDRSFPK